MRRESLDKAALQRASDEALPLVLATAEASWLLCCSGVLLLADENLISRIALLLMLCTGVAICLMLATRRESKIPGRQTIEALARQQQEEACEGRASRVAVS